MIASLAPTLPTVSVAPHVNDRLDRSHASDCVCRPTVEQNSATRKILTTRSLSRETVTVRLVGTQTPRCEIPGVCHVTSVILILWTLARFMIARSTLQALEVSSY